MFAQPALPRSGRVLGNFRRLLASAGLRPVAPHPTPPFRSLVSLPRLPAVQQAGSPPRLLHALHTDRCPGAAPRGQGLLTPWLGCGAACGGACARAPRLNQPSRAAVGALGDGPSPGAPTYRVASFRTPPVPPGRQAAGACRRMDAITSAKWVAVARLQPWQPMEATRNVDRVAWSGPRGSVSPGGVWDPIITFSVAFLGWENSHTKKRSARSPLLMYFSKIHHLHHTELPALALENVLSWHIGASLSLVKSAA